jgi:hypothetical protein
MTFVCQSGSLNLLEPYGPGGGLYRVWFIFLQSKYRGKQDERGKILDIHLAIIRKKIKANLLQYIVENDFYKSITWNTTQFLCPRKKF